MENQRILLIGGGGYLGSALAGQLALNNFEVTVMLRRAISGYQCQYFIGDLLDKDCLLESVRNFDVVINLASVVRTIHKKRYRQNAQGLKNLIEAMSKNNLKRLIYFSSQNVNLSDKGPYAASKEACEKILINSDLDYMIIRPSLIYGLDKQNDFYRLISLIHRWHLAPMIGTGANKIQPVFIGDVAEAVVRSLKNFKTKQIIEIVGRETLSMNQIIDYIGRKLNIYPVKIHLAPGVLKIFKRLIPFDLEGYTEDRISGNVTIENGGSLFFDKLDAILNLYKKGG
jgi:NADH dehydrogenase